MNEMNLKDCFNVDITLEVKNIDEEKRTIEHIISKHEVNAYGHVVYLPELVVYPQLTVLHAHGHEEIRGSVPIAKMIDITTGEAKFGSEIIVKTEFYDDEFSKKIFDLHSRKFLQTWSIRYFPSLRLFGEEAINFLLDKEWTKEQVFGCKEVHRHSLLREYSSVSVPANLGATDLDYKNSIKKLKEAKEKIKELESQVAGFTGGDDKSLIKLNDLIKVNQT